MDAASLIGSADLRSRVGVAVARTALNVAEEQGQAIDKMLEGAKQIQSDSNSKSGNAYGGRIDVSA